MPLLPATHRTAPRLVHFARRAVLRCAVVLRSWLGEQRVLLVALAASAAQQLILGLAGAKWVAFLGISVGSLGASTAAATPPLPPLPLLLLLPPLPPPLPLLSLLLPLPPAL